MQKILVILEQISKPLTITIGEDFIFYCRTLGGIENGATCGLSLDKIYLVGIVFEDLSNDVKSILLPTVLYSKEREKIKEISHFSIGV